MLYELFDHFLPTRVQHHFADAFCAVGMPDDVFRRLRAVVVFNGVGMHRLDVEASELRLYLYHRLGVGAGAWTTGAQTRTCFRGGRATVSTSCLGLNQQEKHNFIMITALNILLSTHMLHEHVSFAEKGKLGQKLKMAANHYTNISFYLNELKQTGFQR